MPSASSEHTGETGASDRSRDGCALKPASFRIPAARCDARPASALTGARAPQVLATATLGGRVV